MNSEDLLSNTEVNVPPKYVEVFTYKQSIDKAAAAGLNVVIPAPNELFIDIDSDEAFDKFLYNRGLMYEHAPGFIEKVIAAPSKSGFPKRHVTVTLDRNITDVERIGLQAILGSDTKRETLSYLSCMHGHIHPTLFFEKPVLGLPAHVEEHDQSVSDILTDEEIPY